MSIQIKVVQFKNISIWYPIALIVSNCTFVLYRAANVFSCAYLINLVRPTHRQIPPKHQKALWYSGKKIFHFLNWKSTVRRFWIYLCCVSSISMNSKTVVGVGLRGAMAFALALQSFHELPEGHGQTIFTATTAIVVLTVSKSTLSFIVFVFLHR